MAMKEKALRRLAEKLNAAGVTWAVGASWLLCRRGILDTYHDFDLQVAEADAEKADKVLSKLGMKSGDMPHPASFRGGYHFDGADIDVTAGMTIPREDGVYHAAFDSTSIAETVDVLGAQVPVGHLEDWYVYYSLCGRDGRAKALADYFAAHGIAHPERFHCAVKESLPAWLESNINSITGG